MFDSEKFIYEIEKRPAIYALNSKEYSDRGIRNRCWNEIGEMMYREWWEVDERGRDDRVKELSRKWKAIRDSYVKDYRRHEAVENGTLPSSKKRRYMFHKQMEFLIPFIRDAREITVPGMISPDKSMEEIGQEENWDTQNEVYSEPYIILKQEEGEAEISELPHKKKRLTKRKVDPALELKTADTSTHSLDNQKEECFTSDRYGNKSFLLSFLPLMDNLPMHKCLEARLKIAQVFQHVTSSTYHSTST